MFVVPRQRHAKWSATEQEAAQGNLFEKLLISRKERDELFTENDPKKLIFMSRSLLLCGLPYRPTNEIEITRTAMTGSGKTTATFYALGKDESGNRIPMARGSDRTFLNWAAHRAIQTKSPFVPYPSVREYFDEMEISTQGENYRALRETMYRLSGLTIVAEHFDRNGEFRAHMPIFSASRLPRALNPKCVVIDGPTGIRFSQEFFDDFTCTPIPFLLSLLRCLSKKPQMQDFALFLHHRCASARSSSDITWAQLRSQLWQSDTNPRRIQLRMKQAVEILGHVWPELNVEIQREGLTIGPPANNIPLVPWVSQRL